jgi:ferredoxin-NADP reductase
MKHRAKIIEIIDETKESKTYLLEKPEHFNWNEGSHIRFGLTWFEQGEKPNKRLFRHMSIMTLPNEGKVGFTTKVPGSSSEFKNKLSQLKIGDEIVFFKLGSRMRLRRCNKPVVLLSMGVGIATMRPLILSFVGDKTNVPCLVNMNVNSSGEFVYKNELDKFVNDDYKNYWIESRKDFYETLNQLSETKDVIYYIVGDEFFIKDIIIQLKSKNVDSSDIILDKREEVVHGYFGL